MCHTVIRIATWDAADPAARLGNALSTPRTAIAYGAQAIVHADQDWMKKAASYRQAIRLVYLGDHCP